MVLGLLFMVILFLIKNHCATNTVIIFIPGNFIVVKLVQRSIDLYPGFYLRKKVGGSTLKIEGSIFGAKPLMGGPKARGGGEPKRGVSPLLVGFGGPPPKF